MGWSLMRRIVAIPLIILVLGCGAVLGSERTGPTTGDDVPTTGTLIGAVLRSSAVLPPSVRRDPWAEFRREAGWWHAREPAGTVARDGQDSAASRIRVIRAGSGSNPKILPLDDPRIYLLVTSAIVHHRPKAPFAADLPLPSPSAEHNAAQQRR
jgi:hypothetical protein